MDKVVLQVRKEIAATKQPFDRVAVDSRAAAASTYGTFPGIHNFSGVQVDIVAACKAVKEAIEKVANKLIIVQEAANTAVERAFDDMKIELDTMVVDCNCLMQEVLLRK